MDRRHGGLDLNDGDCPAGFLEAMLQVAGLQFWHVEDLGFRAIGLDVLGFTDEADQADHGQQATPQLANGSKGYSATLAVAELARTTGLGMLAIALLTALWATAADGITVGSNTSLGFNGHQRRLRIVAAIGL